MIVLSVNCTDVPHGRHPGEPLGRLTKPQVSHIRPIFPEYYGDPDCAGRPVRPVSGQPLAAATAGVGLPNNRSDGDRSRSAFAKLR